MRKLCLVFMLCLIESTWEASWSYDDESQWPGVCSFGREQSPINIISDEADEDYSCEFMKSPLSFRGHEKVSLSGRNNGHTLEWKVSPGSSATLSGGPLTEDYRLIQFHLHWISEHAIDGQKFPMEIHLVHKKSSLTEDSRPHPETYAVIGIPVQIKEDCPEDPFQDVMRDITLILNNSEILPSRDIDVKSLLSPDPQSFYTYRGSLTTPNCAESVTWIFNDKPTYISGEKYKTIMKTKIGSATNFRSLQPLNFRLVHKSVNSCWHMQPNFLAVLGSLLHCASVAIGHIFNTGIGYFFDFRRSLSRHSFSP